MAAKAALSLGSHLGIVSLKTGGMAAKVALSLLGKQTMKGEDSHHIVIHVIQEDYYVCR